MAQRKSIDFTTVRGAGLPSLLHYGLLSLLSHCFVSVQHPSIWLSSGRFGNCERCVTIMDGCVWDDVLCFA